MQREAPDLGSQGRGIWRAGQPRVSLSRLPRSLPWLTLTLTPSRLLRPPLTGSAPVVSRRSEPQFPQL